MWASQSSFASQAMGWQNSPVVFGNDANQCMLKDHHSTRCGCRARPWVLGDLFYEKEQWSDLVDSWSCTVYLTYYILNWIGSFDSLKFEKNIWLRVIYVTGSRTEKIPSSVTNNLWSRSLIWAERKPNVVLVIYTALLDRLAVLNRHMLVWIGWFPFIP